MLGVIPIDLTATATTVVGYIGEAATAGALVFAALYGLRMVVKGFKTVGK